MWQNCRSNIRHGYAAWQHTHSRHFTILQRVCHCQPARCWCTCVVVLVALNCFLFRVFHVIPTVDCLLFRPWRVQMTVLFAIIPIGPRGFFWNLLASTLAVSYIVLRQSRRPLHSSQLGIWLKIYRRQCCLPTLPSLTLTTTTKPATVMMQQCVALDSSREKP